MTGIELIAAERARQQEVLGYNADHDRGHKGDELAEAGAWYALEPRRRSAMTTMAFRAFEEQYDLEPIWPPHWVFRGNTSRIRELQKAGALIAAEIDRLLGVSR